jgi:hypothetical protein
MVTLPTSSNALIDTHTIHTAVGKGIMISFGLVTIGKP